MEAILLFAALYAICKIACAASAKRKEERRKAEAARIRAEVKWQKEQSQALLKKQREMEREQAKQRAEQKRLAKEQERQAAQLAKHEERIAKMEFALEKANYDIAFLQDRIANLKEQIEYTDKIRREAKPGSKEERTAVNHIMTLQNQLHTANVRLGKARFDKERAEEFLAA